MRPMTTAMRWLAGVLGLLLVALLINLTAIQVFRAESLSARTDNARGLVEEYSQPRGPILVGAEQVAVSVSDAGSLKYLRTYPKGPLYASATGFYSLIYGRTGIERAENAVLSGNDPRLPQQTLTDLLLRRPVAPGSVTLTLDPAAQAAAYAELEGQSGAVVALEPTTGRILVLASSPSFDPNLLSGQNGTEVTAAYDKLEADPDQPLLNRPLARTYPPGSTFKLVTTAAALSSGEYTPTTQVPGPARLPLPGTSISLPNFNGKPCGDGTPTLTEALRYSCNTSFGAIGIDLGDEALRAQAEKFGFNSTVAVPMIAAESVFPAGLNEAQTAQAAIGQFDVRSTALQMAMVGAGIANNGVVMQPTLIEEVRDSSLGTLQRIAPTPLSTAVTPLVATQLNAMMVDVVENGTGKPVAIEGVTVAGKTGTAQTAKGVPPHAWFVAFAPAEAPEVAVAVVVEFGGDAGSEATGGKVAAPIARAVMEAILATGGG